ncbi:MAG TPA: transporter substrate-binding domain-containing protein [Oceanithermus profundus]|uniref:Transporter substrate-binding domain-containing protein n=1 Tax=Oceanithermus profundus TaxID=187137 RepID=A0A7C4VDL0_9DEIN|nr:transporter substrate-binding domain-containing protein [Oceanithermus profundus]
MRRGWLFPLLAAVSLAFAAPLRVGVKPAPPFALQGPDGRWEGLAVELWEAAAERLGLDFVYVPTDLTGMLDGVAAGELDLAVGALTITAERERRFDFSNAYFATGLGIAVPARGGGLGALLRGLLDVRLLYVVLVLAAGVGVVSWLVWRFERRDPRNPEGRDPRWSLWWAVITLIGYDDTQPSSLAGRVVAVLWMVASVVGVAALTAALTTALTVNRLESSVSGPDDLYKVRVGTVPRSSAAAYLERRRIHFVPFPNLDAAMDALELGRVEAVVYDAPLLQHQALGRDGVRVLDARFEPQNYAFALPSKSPLREDLNRVLLEHLQSQAWRDALYRYLGER